MYIYILVYPNAHKVWKEAHWPLAFGSLGEWDVFGGKSQLRVTGFL